MENLSLANLIPELKEDSYHDLLGSKFNLPQWRIFLEWLLYL